MHIECDMRNVSCADVYISKLKFYFFHPIKRQDAGICFFYLIHSVFHGSMIHPFAAAQKQFSIRGSYECSLASPATHKFNVSSMWKNSPLFRCGSISQLFSWLRCSVITATALRFIFFLLRFFVFFFFFRTQCVFDEPMTEF